MNKTPDPDNIRGINLWTRLPTLVRSNMSRPFVIICKPISLSLSIYSSISNVSHRNGFSLTLFLCDLHFFCFLHRYGIYGSSDRRTGKGANGARRWAWSDNYLLLSSKNQTKQIKKPKSKNKTPPQQKQNKKETQKINKWNKQQKRW